MRITKKLVYFLSACLLVFCFTGCEFSSSETASDRIARVDEFLTGKYKDGVFNGNALVAYGDTVYIRSLGYSRRREFIELDSTNLFYIGSLAKQFTAAAIQLLQEEGKLQIDDPIINYIDSLPGFCNSITIRHMLNHTSGLPDYYSLGLFKSGMTNEMVWRGMREIEALDFEPGTQYKYSNSAYVFLSMIVERASGISFREYLSERIFEPLEMELSLVYDETRPIIPFRALGHNRDGTLNDYNAFTTGGGGIFSTVLDLYTWCRALDSLKVLPESAIEEAYSPVQLNDSTVSQYGFGWMLSDENPAVVRHSGSLAGYRSYMYRNRDTGTVVILLSNFTDNVSEHTQTIVALLDE